MVEAFEHRWGYRSSERVYYVTAAAASVLLWPEEEMYDSEEFTNLSKAFFPWFKAAQEWASVWAGMPLGDFDNSHESALHIPDGGRYITGSPARMRTLFVPKQPLSRAQVSGALRRASRGEHLPVEHQMLLSAEDAQLGGDLRKAVIDAATAAEVALASYVADHLRKKDLASEFIDEMIKDVNGVANLHVLCTRLGGEPGVSKNRLTTELADIRNKAAHGGKIPTSREAIVAGKHAVTIVRALRPLPQV